MLQDAKIVAVIPSRDLGRARTFYEKMLGLVPERVSEDTGQVVYSMNGTSFMVYSTEAAPGEATKLGFMVSDLDGEMSDLRNHGIVFEDFDLPYLKTVGGVMEIPEGRAAWFKDLDGNYLVLTEMKE
jgi:predicted enzyme related to lactoylglutathione lyase